MKQAILIFLAVFVFCVDCSSGQDYDIFQKLGQWDEYGSEKLSKTNQITVKKRADIVKAELKTLKNHPWAGTYSHSINPGAARQIVIAPKAGFAYTSISTCLDSLMDQNYGDVTWKDGRLKLLPTLENDGRGFEWATEYFLIPWHDQYFLVPADEIIDFCNSVNRGGIGFYLRREEPTPTRMSPYVRRPLVPTGIPNVPDEFKLYLLKEPVDGEITAVGETKEIRKNHGRSEWSIWQTAVTVNKGSQDGMLPGIEFLVTNPEPRLIYRTIRLTDVDETESKGVYEESIKAQQDIKPQVGWLLSTCAPHLRQKQLEIP
jgi:hypothetical protein